MLNWNILDADGLNRYIHAEKIDVKEQENIYLYLKTANYGPCYQCCFLRKQVIHILYDELKNGTTNDLRYLFDFYKMKVISMFLKLHNNQNLTYLFLVKGKEVDSTAKCRKFMCWLIFA